MKTGKDIQWDLLRCEEASMFSLIMKINCGRPAEVIIYHNGDRRAWAMCLACADHNLRNRGGIELARKETIMANQAEAQKELLAAAVHLLEVFGTNKNLSEAAQRLARAVGEQEEAK